MSNICSFFPIIYDLHTSGTQMLLTSHPRSQSNQKVQKMHGKKCIYAFKLSLFYCSTRMLKFVVKGIHITYYSFTFPQKSVFRRNVFLFLKTIRTKDMNEETSEMKRECNKASMKFPVKGFLSRFAFSSFHHEP